MVFVVDQTLMIVSSAHGVPSSSIVPPHRSTTSSPSWTTATDAPDVLARVEVGDEHVPHSRERARRTCPGSRPSPTPCRRGAADPTVAPVRRPASPAGGSMCSVAQRRLPALGGVAAPHEPGGHACQHGVIGKLAPHDGARGDHGVPPEPCARQDDRPGADPRPAADLDGVLGRPLLGRSARPGPRTRGSGRSRSSSGPGDHVVADDHGPVGDEVVAPPDRAPVRRSAAPGSWPRAAAAVRMPCRPRGTRAGRRASRRRWRCAPRRAGRRTGT